MTELEVKENTFYVLKMRQAESSTITLHNDVRSPVQRIKEHLKGGANPEDVELMLVEIAEERARAVERDPRDSRIESWKIQGSKSEWGKLSRKVQVIGKLHPKDRLNLVANLVDDCVKDISEAKRSLGIVKPNIEKCYFCREEDFDPTLQATLFGVPLPSIKKQYRESPKIQYRCTSCKTKKHHDQTVLEWGFYEWMRKNPDSIEQVWENAQIFSPKHDSFFFVGNMRDRRTAFLIISIRRLEKGAVLKPLVPFRKWTRDN